MKKILISTIFLGSLSCLSHGQGPYKMLVNHPADTNNNDTIEICVNRTYSDCDYNPYYDASTNPNDADLLIPFSGRLEVLGEVVKIYGPDNYDELQQDFPNAQHTTNGYPTNIYVESNSLTHNSYPLGNRHFHALGELFTQHLIGNLQESGTGFRKRTIVNWNLNRAEGNFGSLTNFDRYTDTNWFINIVFMTELRGRKTLKTFTFGSEDPSGYFIYQSPPLQIITQ